MKLRRQEGYITLEACITLVLFMFLMFFLIGLMTVFMGRATITHTLLQTAQSLSMDQYETEKLGANSAGVESSIGAYIKEIIRQFGGEGEESQYFTDKSQWYIGASGSMKSTAKNRFIGYLSNGNKERADKILKIFNVISSIEGIDFSKSKVQNGDLYLTVNYRLEYSFNAFSLNSIPMEQTVRVRMLK